MYVCKRGEGGGREREGRRKREQGGGEEREGEREREREITHMNLHKNCKMHITCTL